MTHTSFAMSEKAFYRSRFSGILPCEILEVGSKKIRIFIEGYNSKLWVPVARLISVAEFSSQLNKPFVRLIKKIKPQKPTSLDKQDSADMEELKRG